MTRTDKVLIGCTVAIILTCALCTWAIVDATVETSEQTWARLGLIETHLAHLDRAADH